MTPQDTAPEIYTYCVVREATPRILEVVAGGTPGFLPHPKAGDTLQVSQTVRLTGTGRGSGLGLKDGTLEAEKIEISILEVYGDFLLVRIGNPPPFEIRAGDRFTIFSQLGVCPTLGNRVVFGDPW